MLHLTYTTNTVTSPKEVVLGIHTTNPSACVHIQNRAELLTPFRIDSATGTNICSVDNSGNLSSYATMQAPTVLASSSIAVNYPTTTYPVEMLKEQISIDQHLGRS